MGIETQTKRRGMERRNRNERKRIDAKAGYKNKDLLR